MTKDEGPRILDAAQAAETLGIESAAMQRLLIEGRIPAVLLGHNWLIREESLWNFRKFLEEEEARQTQARRTTTGSKDKSSPRTASSLEDARRGGHFSYVLKGRRRDAKSAIDILAQVVDTLAAADPDFLTRFSHVRGRSRRYVAQRKSDLYPGRPDLAEQYVRSLGNGWWLGTNYNRKVIESILRKVCDVAGIVFGVDLILMHAKKDIDISKAMAFVGSGADPKSDVARRHDEYYVETLTSGRS